MDLSTIKDLYVGSTPVQSAWLGGTKVWERTPAVDIQAIKDAMLLWYDLKRQGATNESMAATPELVNLAYDPDKAHVIDWTQFSTRGDGVQQFSIEITSTTNYWVINQGAYHRTNSIPSFYVEVANLPEGKVINYFYGNGSDERQTYAITYNGLHKLPACKISPNVTTASGFFISNENGQTVADVVGTTITQVNPSLNATCYNFAWSGMSGIGGYNQNPLSGNSYTKNVVPVENGAWDTLYSKDNYNKNKSWTIKVTCDTKPFTEDDNVYIFTRNVTTGEMHHLSDNIINNIPLTIPIYDGEILEDGIWINLESLVNNTVTIEILPKYPNALVADGVDDYAKVEGLPLLTDYTVIAKRNILTKYDNEYRAFAAKSNTAYQGAFIFERLMESDSTRVELFSFGNRVYFNIDTIYNDDISYMTTNSYNGTPINKGDGVDEDMLTIFGRKVGVQLISAALYSFILFNRTLTEEEINWVKTNLIEGDTEL